MASLVLYGLTVDALKDFLPLDVRLDIKTVRHDALKVAQRCEAELGDEQVFFVEGCQRDWEHLPIPMDPSPWAPMAGMCGIGTRRSRTLR